MIILMSHMADMTLMASTDFLSLQFFCVISSKYNNNTSQEGYTFLEFLEFLPQPWNGFPFQNETIWQVVSF